MTRRGFSDTVPAASPSTAPRVPRLRLSTAGRFWTLYLLAAIAGTLALLHHLKG